VPYSEHPSYKWMHKNARFRQRFEEVAGRSLDEAMTSRRKVGEWEQPSLFDKEEPPEISSAEWDHLTGKGK